MGRCGRQNMLPPYLKIWEWEWIFGHAVKAISSLGVHGPWLRLCVDFSPNFFCCVQLSLGVCSPWLLQLLYAVKIFIHFNLHLSADLQLQILKMFLCFQKRKRMYSMQFKVVAWKGLNCFWKQKRKPTQLFKWAMLELVWQFYILLRTLAMSTSSNGIMKLSTLMTSTL